MIILIDTGQIIWQSSTPFYDKNYSQLRTEGNCLKIIKDINVKPVVNILKGKKPEQIFPLR